ncbi:MAG: hypothetical protein SGCHY_000587 [Lobulomycetales sp.]
MKKKFSTQASMLALVDSVNQDTEKAINTKLERMDKVKRLVKEQKAKRKLKEKQKKSQLDAVKREIRDSDMQKKRKKKGPAPKASGASEPAESKKTPKVHFAL